MNDNRRNQADKSLIRLSYITHFYCNQNDISSVTDLLKRYEKYESDLLDRIQFVIVDDGSPVQYDVPEFNLNLTWLRILQDIPWNQGGARNLGALYAKSDKILLTDLDHEFPEETLAYMVKKGECGRNFYKIYRTNAETGKLQKGHANTFLISRARFMRFFGYDEEFAGHYGAEDFRFVKIQKYHGSRQMYLNSKFRCFARNDINRDTSYHTLERDLTYNTPIDARKKLETETYGPDSGYSRMFLNYDWRVLKDINREAKVARRKRMLWKHLWYWRWLVGFR